MPALTSARSDERVVIKRRQPKVVSLEQSRSDVSRSTEGVKPLNPHTQTTKVKSTKTPRRSTLKSKKDSFFSELSDTHKRRSLPGMSTAQRRWQTALQHKKVVEDVVDNYFYDIHKKLNLERDDLIQVGLEIASRASHFAPSSMTDYLFISVRKGLADYVTGRGRTKTLKRLEFVGVAEDDKAQANDRSLAVTEAGYEQVEDTDQGQYLFRITDQIIDTLKAPNSLWPMKDEEFRELMRERFSLRFECGMDYQQIANVQGVTMQAVQQSLDRVLACVRERMEVEG